jgi:hypothetical protein
VIAVRVANVPADKFEKADESDKPPPKDGRPAFLPAIAGKKKLSTASDIRHTLRK